MWLESKQSIMASGGRTCCGGGGGGGGGGVEGGEEMRREMRDCVDDNTMYVQKRAPVSELPVVYVGVNR